MELIVGLVIGAVLTGAAFVISPKVSDVAGNFRRSRALAKAHALVTAAEANLKQLEAAKAAIAAAAVVPPPAPPNPVPPKV
jgi:hypothetical protein